MAKKIFKLQLSALFFLCCAFFVQTVYAQESGVIIIQPDPIGGIPEDGEGGEEAPEPIDTLITVNPETLNLSSNIKFITTYIGFEEQDVRSILRETVKITEISGESIEPVYALERPCNFEDHSGDGTEELMVKFSAAEVKSLMTGNGDIDIVICGSLETGEEFKGGDSVRVIHNYTPAYERRKFHYKLKDNLSPGISIVKAAVWMNYSSTDRKYLLNSKNSQNSSLNRKFNYKADQKYLPAKNGSEYEWDVTGEVKTLWENGTENFEIIIDYDETEAVTHPRLVVTYNNGTVEKIKNAKPVGPTITRSNSQKKTNLYFTGADAEIYGLSALKICGWNKYTRTWEPVKDSDIDKTENLLTTSDISYSKYRILSFDSSSVGDSKPAAGNLGQNYPNPFNPGTTINYTIPEDSQVTIKIYNIRGQRVATVVDAFKNSGSHSVYFDGGEKLSRGIYYYQLKAGDFISTRRMVVLH